MDTKGHETVQTVQEMFAQYPNEWIFFEVVEENEYEWPTKGILLVHHPERDDFDKMVMQHSVQHGAIRYTGSIVPPEYQRIPLPWLMIAGPWSDLNMAAS
jgi:hypothetical protein